MKEIISVVIPCYNSEKTIKAVYDEIKKVFSEKLVQYDYELILVNDGSKDNVWHVIKSIACDDNNVTGINFAKNFGQHAAIMAGLRQANGNLIVCMDDDGQTPAEEMPNLINTLVNDDLDVCFASYKKKKHSSFRNIGSKVNEHMLCSFLNKPKELSMMSFCVIKRFVVEQMIKYENSYPYIGGLILSITDKLGNYEIEHRERQVGKSGYTLKKLLGLWLNGFTAFSVKPLRISAFVGVLLGLLGGIGVVGSVIAQLIQGFQFFNTLLIISVVLLVSGVNLIFIWLLGEYVARSYISLNKKPQYVVKDVVSSKQEKQKEVKE